MGRRVHPASARLATPVAPATPTSPLITLILATVVLSALLMGLAMLAVRARGWGRRMTAIVRPAWAPRIVSGALLLAVAAVVSGGPPSAVPGGSASIAQSPASRSGVTTLDSGSSVSGVGLGLFSSSPLTRGAVPQIWRDLLAIETVIENGSAPNAVPLTLLGVQESAERNAALIAEEALYKGAIRDPATTTTTTLVDAAASTRDAEVITVVSTDLNIVRTAAAMATQARVGSLSPAQVAAISARKPLITPMDGSITQPFGPSDLGIEPSRLFGGVWYPHFHSGLDIAAAEGAPVHAAADGVVRAAGVSTDAGGSPIGYGQYVVIEHGDGFSTLYGHLLDLNGHSGDTVIQGQVIGHEGSTGNSTGPHLHFEVRVDGEPVNPLPYIT